MKWTGFFIFLCCILSWPPAQAAGARRPTAKAAPAISTTQGQWAIVKTDNAIIYEAADFDSGALMYLPVGQKIRISKSTTGSYFKFFRVKVSGNKIGYITSIDVLVQSEREARNSARAAGKNSKARKGQQQRSQDKYPPVKEFMQTKYLGIFGGLLNYKENIPGVNANESLVIYGFKLTGPKTIIDLPTDLTFTLHYGAPTYYNSFSNVKASGFVLISDFLLLFPFLERRQSAFHFGFGPLIDYSNFQFGTPSGIANSSDLSIGLAAALGFGVKLGLNWAARGEYKILWERANYSAYQLAIQNRF
jgi:hypothetical protein